MNSFDVLKYGQLTLLHELEEFPREAVLGVGPAGTGRSRTSSLTWLPMRWSWSTY